MHECQTSPATGSPYLGHSLHVLHTYIGSASGETSPGPNHLQTPLIINLLYWVQEKGG